MAKDLIEDIKRPKRSLEDILPKARVMSEDTDKQPLMVHPNHSTGRNRRYWPMILLIILVVIVGSYFVSLVFGHATVIVTPRRIPLTVSGIYRVIKLPSETASSTNLGFQTMTIPGNATITVSAEGQKQVSERASGMIVVTNRFSQKVERLVANTRFETATGKIYRIRESALIPGYTLTGGIMKPGELTIKVTADKPGVDYNGEVTTLTIPGFVGDIRFNTITARADTPFTGGFVGQQKVVNPTARLVAENELTNKLKERLLAEAVGQTPDKYVWYPKSVFWRLSELSVIDDPSLIGAVKITRKVELVVPIFSRVELSQELARRFVPSYNGALVLVDNVDHLNFQPTEVLTDPQNLTEFTFTLEGKSELIWQFDPITLTRDLAGRGANDYQAVFVKYPSIVASQTTFSPPWLLRFPTDPKRISLTIETPSAKIIGTTNQYDTPNGN